MRVLLDENIPRQLAKILIGHKVSAVDLEGWKGKANGELLRLAETRFDAMVTSDSGLSFQQNLVECALSLVVVPTNNLTLLRANAVALVTTLEEIAAYDHHAVIVIDWRGRRTMWRPDRQDEQPKNLEPVNPYKR